MFGPDARSLISIDSPEAGEEASSREMAAMQRTLQCIAQCRIDEMFADSKFLRAESLTELVKAIMMAPGPVSRIAASGEDSDTAEASRATLLKTFIRLMGHPPSKCSLCCDCS